MANAPSSPTSEAEFTNEGETFDEKRGAKSKSPQRKRSQQNATAAAAGQEMMVPGEEKMKVGMVEMRIQMTVSDEKGA